ncbi:MAG: phosphoribosyltransferase family protein [Oscillatoria sp. PMC 1068.18]|nr:phosphoribosyltransferase family protein [Oscillatoria sp. PMC 1076.18]MEC4990160.1 phosphoribosyltransferase family protein [Oscillatoria sp. PMC 1068.18]
MSTITIYRNRLHAGEQLGEVILPEINKLRSKGNQVQPIVYALPRGGIPVAFPVAQQLSCPLDIIVAKKITLPKNPELAIGAVSSEGKVLWSNSGLYRQKSSQELKTAQQEAETKAKAQLELFADYLPQVDPRGAIAIIIDDGIATGMTIAVAAQAAKAKKPAQVWICTPVAPKELIPHVKKWGTRAIILETPDPFFSVSRFYIEFPQTSSEEAIAYLNQHNQRLSYVPNKN